MSNVRILKPGDEQALERFLRPRLASSMFLLGNLRVAGLVDRGGRYEGTYAAAWDGGAVTAVVAHYWNGALVFQAAGLEANLAQVSASASARPVTGFIGPGAQVGAALEGLELSELPRRMDETEYLYRLGLENLVVPEPLRSGMVSARRLRTGDLPLATEWRVAYAVEAIHEEAGPALRQRSRAALEESLQEGCTWLLERGGEPVSMTSFNAAIPEAVQVGGVYTPPALRGRGYARCAVAASLLEARAAGAGEAILFTGIDNLAAQRAYQALGFERIGDYRIAFLQESIRREQRDR